MARALSFLGGISALDIIGVIGGFTALLAALIAIQQNDIKRILAYSTLSQLGYMVMAVGCGGPDAGDVPPHDARGLQSAAVPRGRLGHPWPAITSRTSGRWAVCGTSCR
jgi:NADH:ubiquinone oxidoreductase subunit 5 (subunit L)/multisubunit Na+/H+ antiporter MnhA subunit